MTEINFYVSKEQGLEQRFNIASRLIKLGLDRKLKIFVHTENETLSSKFDDYLWTNEQQSFIPHRIATNSSSERTFLRNEIIISNEFEPLHHTDYLINLSTQRPTFFSRFIKVAEVIDTDEEILTAGRKRYSFYRDRGYTLQYHQL